MIKMDVVILASGNGSTFQAILDTCKHINVRALITDNPKSYALERAKAALLPYAVTEHKDVRKAAQYFTPELVILAGYMRILDEAFIRTYPHIINIHPSLLPKYKGLDTYERVLAAGDEEHGTTVHWVNDDLDAGEIIAQEIVFVSPEDTIASLQEKTQAVEKKLYPHVIDQIANGEIALCNQNIK